MNWRAKRIFWIVVSVKSGDIHCARGVGFLTFPNRSNSSLERSVMCLPIPPIAAPMTMLELDD